MLGVTLAEIFSVEVDGNANFQNAVIDLALIQAGGPLHRSFSQHFNLLYHDCTILACSFMKQRGVLCPLKFEKACSRKDLRAFMLLYRFMKSGQLLPIPNFIYLYISLKNLCFMGFCGFFGLMPFLRHFLIWIYRISSVYTTKL